MSFDEMPPEGRLTGEQRARMRAGLLAAAGDDSGHGSGRSRPWLTPVAAAAAVALLSAGVAVGGLAMAGGDGDEGTRPASQQTSAAPSPARTSPSTPSLASSSPTPMPPDGACVDEVASLLPRAEAVDRVGYGPGTTYLFEAGNRWVVCDTWAVLDGGVPTLLGDKTFNAPLGKDLFLISQNYSMNASDGAQYVAAGPRLASVAGLSYRFPTGDKVEAILTDRMWQMVYLLPDPPRRAWTDPVVVTVTLDDGNTTTYDLTALDLCAQLNHGC